MPRKYSGFSFIEVLVVIAVLGVLLAVLLVAINPSRQFAQDNNTARKADVNLILDSIRKYADDNKGKFPKNMPAKGATAEIVEGTGGADICSDISPLYLGQLPVDPSLNLVIVGDCAVKTYNTGYQVSVDASGKVVTVSAPAAESVGGVTPIISVSR